MLCFIYNQGRSQKIDQEGCCAGCLPTTQGFLLLVCLIFFVKKRHKKEIQYDWVVFSFSHLSKRTLLSSMTNSRWFQRFRLVKFIKKSKNLFKSQSLGNLITFGGQLLLLLTLIFLSLPLRFILHSKFHSFSCWFDSKWRCFRSVLK